MKRGVLFLTGVLSLCVYSGCYDDPLDSKPPDGKTVAVFDVRDARAWFEDHADELHLLHLKSSPETKNRKSMEKPLLTPVWDKGDARSNLWLQVVEVPLLTNSVSFVHRNSHRMGEPVINENCIAQRKMVVMRRPNGYTRLFVMTLIPDREYPRKHKDFISNFRYLGKNDFSGYVMFSDPDGSFVEGYHYWEGHREYPVKVTPMQKARPMLSSVAEYTTLGISELKANDDGTYTGDEENNRICDYCNGEGCAHCANPNCPECYGAGCVHCKNVPLDEVTITPDPSDPSDPFDSPVPVGPVGPSDPIDNYCPWCGRLTCNGDCRKEEEEKPIPPPPPIEVCLGERCTVCGMIIPGTQAPGQSSMDCPLCHCPLELQIYCPPTATLLVPYMISLQLKPQREVTYTLEISKKYKEEWYKLTTGTATSFMRISRSSGYWRIRASCEYNKTTYFSNVVEVEERFPTVAEITSNSSVATELDNYWTKTKNFASPNGRKEFGCWIYLDTENGRYVCEEIPNNNVVQGCAGTHGSIQPTNPKPQVSIGPMESGYEYVAIFHTHTPLTYCPADARRKPVGPSPGDQNYVVSNNIPGIVYDYETMYDVISGTPIGLVGGHPLDAAAKLYYIGPDRRPTKY